MEDIKNNSGGVIAGYAFVWSGGSDNRITYSSYIARINNQYYFLLQDRLEPLYNQPKGSFTYYPYGNYKITGIIW